MSQRSIEKARRLEERARQLQYEGKFVEAEEPLVVAIGIWRLLRGPSDLDALNDEIALAASYRRRGDATRAIAILERVTAELVKFFPDPEASHVYRLGLNNLGVAYRAAGQLDKARAALDFCLTLHGLADESDEAMRTERARLLDNLAAIASLQGDQVAAERFARESLGLWVELRGLDDVDSATATCNLGAAWMRQGRWDDAHLAFLDGFRRYVQLLGRAHPTVADCCLLLGELAYRRGDRAEATRVLRLSLEISRACGRPEDHPAVIDAQSLLALADDALAN